MTKPFGNISHVELKKPLSKLKQELEYFIQKPDGSFRRGLDSIRSYKQAEVDALVNEGKFVPLPEKGYIEEGQRVVMHDDGEIFVADNHATLVKGEKVANKTLIAKIEIGEEAAIEI